MNLSNISSGPLNAEDRKRNLSFIRLLYTFLTIQLLLVLVYSLVALKYWPDWTTSWWPIALTTFILALILLLASLLVPATRKPPLNFVIYILFTLCFAHCVSYLVCKDTSRLVLFAVWCLFAVALGYCVYSYSTSTYMKTLFSLFVVAAMCLAVFVGFLIFSKVEFIGLLMVMLGVLVFGFYLNYDVRRMVRGGALGEDDPVGGAVRVWGESCMVFCRFVELLGRGCCNAKL